jgi:poly(A) polymerase
VLKVLYRLLNAGFVAYLVGGGVRDLMLERKPKDFDVGTSAHPHQIRDLFRNSRLIGRRFRLVHVFFGQQNIEVATFRRLAEEQPADGDLLIKQDNTFGTPEEDALRRDFTVNALFYNPQTFRVIDYVGGLADLKARLIRTVGDPEFRMREDPVRMIRAVRFAAKLGFQIEPATRAAIERHREDLVKSSVPRLIEEIFRTFGSTGAARALELTEQLGLLDVMIPRLSAYLRNSRELVAETLTCRNLDAMARAVEAGAEPSHELTLACLFLDLYLHDSNRPPAERPEMLTELRERGFPRGDTERMRLLLEAFIRLLKPSRRTLRLVRRPYFPQALNFYRIVGPNYPHDARALERIISAGNAKAATPGATNGNVPQRRRRRRRRKRWPDDSETPPSSLPSTERTEG